MSNETFFRIFPLKEVADELRRKTIVDIPVYPFRKHPSMYPKNSFLTRAFLGSIHHFFETSMYQQYIYFLDHIRHDVHEGDILPTDPIRLGLLWTIERIEEEVGPLTESSDPTQINKLKKISTAEQFATIKKVNELVIYRAVVMPDGIRYQVIIA